MENISMIFHQATKQHRLLPKDPNQWPKAWSIVSHKEYSRLKKISLPSNENDSERALLERDVLALLRGRRSFREFSDRSISLQELSVLLKHSIGIVGTRGDGKDARTYPSGGGRYSIETYALVLKDGEGLSRGLYHYNVKGHFLSVLHEDIQAEEITPLFSYPWVQNASLVLFHTSLFNRTQMKYGDRGYRYVLIEAGHIGQNVSLMAEALGLKTCALAGTIDKKVEEFLDIDGVSESLIYSLAIGKG